MAIHPASAPNARHARFDGIAGTVLEAGNILTGNAEIVREAEAKLKEADCSEEGRDR